jgi:hypothetical protein
MSTQNVSPADSTPPVAARDWSRRRFLTTGLAAAGAGLPAGVFGAPAPGKGELAFFVVSDTHYEAILETPEKLDPERLVINQRVVDLLNSLPGKDLPAEMGGAKIQTPAGVLHLGDIIDSGDKGSGAVSLARQATEWNAFTADYGLTGKEGRLKHPVYEIHGNHDSVNELNLVIKSMIERNKTRVGVSHISASGLHYSWDWAGIHFIALGIVVGHNPDGLPVGRYKAHDSLEFLKKDLAEKIAKSGRPVVILHHIDLLRYSKEPSKDSEKGGEWSAPDVAAYYRAIQGFNITAVFHGHLHALRTDNWNGTDKSVEGGIPVFGARNCGAGGANRSFFYCCLENEQLVVREVASMATPDGWQDGSVKWINQWKVPVKNRA